MAILSKEDIFAADDKKTLEVEVPEWGGTVTIAVMSGGDKDRWEESLVGKNGGFNYKNMRARLVSYCIVDDHGNRMFSDDEVVKLSKKSAVALERVYEECAKINVVTQEDIEDMAKNS